MTRQKPEHINQFPHRTKGNPTVFWLQLTTLLLINGLVYGIAFTRSPRPQHGNAGDGGYTVWQLIDHVNAGHRLTGLEDEPTGRHHLRDPARHVPLPPHLRRDD